MDEMNERAMDRFVEAHLQYLRGEGPAPDLSELSDHERDSVARMLDLVDAMADSLPPSPPIDEDPVAVGLGLVSRSASSGAQPPQADPVLSAVEDWAFRFNNAIDVEPVTMPLHEDAWRSIVLCRSIAEIMLVVVIDAAAPQPGAADARPLFRGSAELTAVVFTTPDALRAAVVTRSESAGRLVPDRGWEEAVLLRWEPLDIALGRHLDRSVPRWDEVASLPAGDLLEDLDEEARRIVDAELARVAKTRPQLSHKQHARDFVATVDVLHLVRWVDAVRARKASGEQLASQISELSKAGNP